MLISMLFDRCLCLACLFDFKWVIVCISKPSPHSPYYAFQNCPRITQGSCIFPVLSRDRDLRSVTKLSAGVRGKCGESAGNVGNAGQSWNVPKINTDRIRHPVSSTFFANWMKIIYIYILLWKHHAHPIISLPIQNHQNEFIPTFKLSETWDDETNKQLGLVVVQPTQIYR